MGKYNKTAICSGKFIRTSIEWRERTVILQNMNFRSFIVLIAVTCLAGCTGNQDTRVLPSSKEELGELLFHEKMLSQDNTISCASCHIPEFAFADTAALSSGVGGKKGRRNTPSAANMSARSFFFHDGRAETLEQQAIGPIENPVEMNLPVDVAISRLNKDLFYLQSFKKIYGESANREHLSDALASFERTLETSDTPFDRYMHDEANAISEAAKRGHKIFNEKGKCFDCHFGPDFTGDEFRNIGLYNEKELNDKGRFEVTGKKEDLGKFKVPGLRNIAVTAPYMHNGMFRTLKEVIDYYNDPSAFVHAPVNSDSLTSGKLNLTDSEKQDLLAFLESLTDKRFKTR
jgi:cytochrome c peroxidase